LLANAHPCAGGFTVAWHALRPLGQMSQTSGISCQRPSLLPSYINNTYCAIYLFALLEFLHPLRRPPKATPSIRPILAASIGRPNKASADHYPANNTQGFAPPKAHQVSNMKTPKKLTPERVGVSFCNCLPGASHRRSPTPADQSIRRGIWLNEPVPECANLRSDLGRSEPRLRGCR
jgi:hypothetical protein